MLMFAMIYQFKKKPVVMSYRVHVHVALKHDNSKPFCNGIRGVRITVLVARRLFTGHCYMFNKLNFDSSNKLI